MILINWNLIGYKKKLSRERKNILKKLQEFKTPPDMGSESDPDTETDESEEISNQLAEAQVLKKHLADIELALTKIKKDTYGICENCKEEISRELLNVAPESQLCQNCKQKISR